MAHNSPNRFFYNLAKKQRLNHPLVLIFNKAKRANKGSIPSVKPRIASNFGKPTGGGKNPDF